MNSRAISSNIGLTYGQYRQTRKASPPAIKTTWVSSAGSVRLKQRTTRKYNTHTGHGGNWLADTWRITASSCPPAFFKKGNAVFTDNKPRVGSCLTLNEVAVRLQVCRRTLEREIAAGRLPCLRIGRSIRIQEADLVGYLTNSRAVCLNPSSS